MKDMINLFNSGLIPEYLKCLAGAISYDPYKIRADVVVKHFIKKTELESNNDVIIVDCQSNVANYLETVLLNHFYSALFTKRCVNSYCNLFQ